MNKIVKYAAAFVLVSISAQLFSQETRFLALSDIHLDPFQTENTFPYKTDSNPFYLNAVMKSIAYKVSHDANNNLLDTGLRPKFIVISGDLITHDFEAKFNTYKANNPSQKSVCYNTSNVKDCMLATIHQVFTAVREAKNSDTNELVFKDIPVYAILGNNDSDTGNYTVNRPFLKSLGGEFFDNISPNVSTDKATFQTNFANAGGAYAEDAPGGLRVMFLNTVLYANKPDSTTNLPKLKCTETKGGLLDANSCTTFRTDQNDFIGREVLNNKPNLIVAHVPPYQQDIGYNIGFTPILNTAAFADSAVVHPYTIAGHWHIYGSLNHTNNVRGKMLSSITYDKGIDAGYAVFSYDNGTIQPVSRFLLVNPSDALKGKSTIDNNSWSAQQP